MLSCEASSASFSRHGVIARSASRCWACSPGACSPGACPGWARRPARRPCSCHQASSPAPPQDQVPAGGFLMPAKVLPKTGCWPLLADGSYRHAPIWFTSAPFYERALVLSQLHSGNIVNGGPADRRPHPGMTAKERARPASAAVAGSIPAVSTPGCRVVEACLVWGQAAGVRFSPPRPAARQHAPLAQRPEQPALNRQVRGSNPWRRTPPAPLGPVSGRPS